MKKEEIYEYFINKLKLSDVKMDESMRNHTSFRIGGKSDIFVTANSIEEIKLVLSFSKENNIPLYIVGNGSNLLVRDGGVRGITLKINLDNIEFDINEDEKKAYVIVGAGVKLGLLAGELCKRCLSGFEFAAGIPGTIGGAVRMNAGAYGGEFKDIVVKSKCIDYDGNEVILDNSDHNFSYRRSRFCDEKLIVLETVLEFNLVEDSSEIEQAMKENLESRKEKQPLEYPSAGSTFKRGEDFITAKLIDECGLKGYSVGDAEVSEKHAGFIVNKGNASAKDVLELAEHIKKCVLEKFGKEIELEVEVIGEE